MTKPVLNYEEYGVQKEGVFVFLHGFMGNRDSLKAVATPLAETFRCLAFDLPGHGRSLFCRSQSLKALKGMEETAYLVLNDLGLLGVDRFSLYGYSMGGRVAQNIALLAPDRIERLILESASFGIADAEERRQRYRRDQALLADVRTQEDLAAFLEQWYRLPLFNTLQGTTQLLKIIEEKRGNSIEELRGALNILSVGNHPYFVHRLAGQRFPLFYFYGEKDDAYQATAKTIEKEIPTMKIIEFPGASHDIHSQFPEMIRQELKRILAANSSALSKVKGGEVFE